MSVSLCVCGHARVDHYEYVRNGAMTWACRLCDPSNRPEYRGRTDVAFQKGTYAEAMLAAMHHEYEEAPP